MELIETAVLPGGQDQLGLYRRGGDYFIKIVGGQDLMNTRAHGSEDALGTLACEGIAERARARVLVGGLGIGFTLAAALRTLARDAEVVVSEIVPAVVQWNRGVLAPFAGSPLNDPRVTVQLGDVAELLRVEREGFDAIILDIDNGPDGLTVDSNEQLYSLNGLSKLREALRPGGVVAVWSAGPDKSFTKRMKRVGLPVEEVIARGHAGKGARHVIWVARKS